MYYFYDEIWFLDECYVWNNTKNGKVYSWVDKNEQAFICDEFEDQIRLGLSVAISNKGRCFYNVIR